jgi:GWxTD domain-containing protein
VSLRHRFGILALVICALPGILFCQDRPHSVEEQLRQFRINRSLLFNYDLYQFAGGSPDSTRLDVIITVVNDLLQFVKESESQYRASFEMTLAIVNEDDEAISDQTYRREFTAQSYKETNSQTRAHAYYTSFNLTPGKYELMLELTDLDIRKSLRQSHPVQILSFDKPLTISNALVSTTLARRHSAPEAFGDMASPAIAAVTQPRSLLSPFLIGKRIHYQASTPLTIYHEFTGQFESDTLMLAYRLLSNKNEVVWKTTKKSYAPPQGRFAHEITLDPGAYDPGLYRLEVFARNHVAQELDELPIYINRVLTRRAEDDTLAIDEIGPLRYITSADEFENLSTTVQDTSITAFWQLRDPTPNTPENELRSEFVHRVRFANRNFVSLIQGRQGWETDQGKAYILYGPPSEIFHPSVEEDVFQHEIWVYDNQQLKTRFVFVFKPEKGEYELISRG